MAKPIGALELRYPMIQFLIKGLIRDKNGVNNWSWPLILWEYKNSEFLWELRKTWFCEGSRK